MMMPVSGSLLTELDERPSLGADRYEKAINIICNTAALLLENGEDVPTAKMISFIEENFTFQKVMYLSMVEVNDTGINDIYKYYGLLEKAGYPLSKIQVHQITCNTRQLGKCLYTLKVPLVSLK